MRARIDSARAQMLNTQTIVRTVLQSTHTNSYWPELLSYRLDWPFLDGVSIQFSMHGPGNCAEANRKFHFQPSIISAVLKHNNGDFMVLKDNRQYQSSKWERRSEYN